MPRMRWTSAVCAAVLGVLLAGCSDRAVTADELDELDGLSDVHVRVANQVFSVGGLDARVGVASGRGERVSFAVVIGEPPPLDVSIQGSSYRLSSSCAGAGFYTVTDRFSAVASTVETAVYHELAPDAYCEG
jgi:hypothetical protein